MWKHSIRDLPSKRLYVFERAGVPKRLRPLVGGKVNVDLIDRNWTDILRVAATMAAGTMRPSQLLRKLAAYPRQNELAAALREVGRIERSLFMIEWTTDPDVRRRALVGLNKGEAHHALKRAINFHQRGELRDRTAEGQHYRVAGLNLLAAVIIYWNTLKLGDAVFARKQAGLDIPAELLAHVSPLGWEHINLTGEYRWPSTGSTGDAKRLGFRPLPQTTRPCRHHPRRKRFWDVRPELPPAPRPRCCRPAPHAGAPTGPARQRAAPAAYISPAMPDTYAVAAAPWCLLEVVAVRSVSEAEVAAARLALTRLGVTWLWDDGRLNDDGWARGAEAGARPEGARRREFERPLRSGLAPDPPAPPPCGGGRPAGGRARPVGAPGGAP